MGGTCTGDLVHDLDLTRLPEAVKRVIRRCITANIKLNPDCDCAIAELTYWSWCRANIAGELLGGGDWFGGAVSETANQVLITTVVDPREKFLLRSIDEHGFLCRLQASGAGSSSSSLQAIDATSSR